MANGKENNGDGKKDPFFEGLEESREQRQKKKAEKAEENIKSRTEKKVQEREKERREDDFFYRIDQKGLAPEAESGEPEPPKKKDFRASSSSPSESGTSGSEAGVSERSEQAAAPAEPQQSDLAEDLEKGGRDPRQVGKEELSDAAAPARPMQSDIGERQEISNEGTVEERLERVSDFSESLSAGEKEGSHRSPRSVSLSKPEEQELTERQAQLIGDSFEFRDNLDELDKETEEGMMRKRLGIPDPQKGSRLQNIDKMADRWKEVGEAKAEAQRNSLKDFALKYNELVSEAEAQGSDLSDVIDRKKSEMVDELMSPIKRGAGSPLSMSGEIEAQFEGAPQAVKDEMQAMKNIELYEDSREVLISEMGEEQYEKQLKGFREDLRKARNKRFSDINEEIQELEKEKEGASEERISEINERLDELKGLKSNVFKDPDKASREIVKKMSSSSDAVHALNMVDQDLPPKERFEQWYYTLYKKNRELGEKIGVLNENGEFRRYPQRFDRDKMFEGSALEAGKMPVYGIMKSVEGATGDESWGDAAEDMMASGMSMSTHEERFLKNERMLRDMAPVFFLNTMDVSENEGFFGPFMKKLDRWYTDNKTVKRMDRETAQNVSNELKEMGVGGVNEKAMEAISSRGEPNALLGEDFSIFNPGSWDEFSPDPERMGETGGMLSGAITMYGFGRGITGAAGRTLRASRGVRKGARVERSLEGMRGSGIPGAKATRMSGRSFGSGARVSRRVEGSGVNVTLRKAKQKGKYGEFVGAANDRVRRSNSLAKYLTPSRESLKEGASFEVTGEIFKNREDEFNFMSGFLGHALGRRVFEMANSKSVKKTVDHVVRMFGDDAPKAIKILQNKGAKHITNKFSRTERQNLGLDEELNAVLSKKTIASDHIKKGLNKVAQTGAVKRVSQGNFRGFGEMGEETVQELTQTWKQSERGQSFWEGVRKKFGEYNEESGEYELALKPVEEFLVTSFAMGFGFGMAGNIRHFNENKHKIENDEKVSQIVGNIVKGKSEGMVEVNKRGEAEFSEEIVGGDQGPVYKVNGKEMSRDQFVQRVDNKQFEDEWKHGNTRVTVKNDPEMEDFLVERFGKGSDEDVDIEDTEEQQQEEKPQSVRELQGRAVDHPEGTGVLRVDDEGQVTLDPIEEGESRVRLGDENEVDVDDFKTLEEGTTRPNVEEKVERVSQGDTEAAESLEQDVVEGRVDPQHAYDQLHQKLSELDQSKAQEYSDPSDLSSSEVMSGIGQMSSEITQVQQQQADQQVDQEEQQEPGQEEVSVDQEQQVDQDEAMPEEEPVEPEGVEYAEDIGKLTVTDEQQQSLNESMNNLDVETQRELKDVVDRIANNPGDSELVQELDAIVDRTTLNDNAKENIKNIGRDISNREATVTEEAAQEGDAETMKASIRRDMKKIRDREATPAETGIGKKMAQLKKMDAEAHKDVLNEYQEVYDDYQQEKKGREREQYRAAEGDVSEEITQTYIDQVEKTSAASHPNQNMSFDEAAKDFDEGRITEDQFERVRRAFENKKKRYNEHRRFSGDTMHKVRKEGGRRATKSSNSSYAQQVINDVVNRVQKAFPNVKVEHKLENVKLTWEQRMGREVSQDEVPAGFFYDGTVYLNEEKIGPDTPIHEMAHLWLDVARNKNEPVHQEGKNALMEDERGREVFMDILKDPAYSDLTVEQAKEEALARLIGEEGAQIAERSGFRQVWDRFVDMLRRLIGAPRRVNLSQETLKGYTQKVAKDLLRTTPITEEVTSDQLAKMEEGKLEQSVEIEGGLLSDHTFFERKIKSLWNQQMSESLGAGQDIKKVLRKSDDEIKADAMNANEIILPRYKQALKNYFNALEKDGWTLKERKEHSTELIKQVNDALAGDDAQMNALPKEVRSSIADMRGFIDEMSYKLSQRTDFLDDDIRATITQNLGVYVHRSYRKNEANQHWTLEDAKGNMDSQQWQDVQNEIREKFSVKSIDKAKVEFDQEGVPTLVFENKRGVESDRKAFIGDTEAESILDTFVDEGFMNESEASDIKGKMRQGQDFEHELSERISGTQNLVTFRMNAGQIEQIMRKIAEGDAPTAGMAMGGTMRGAGLGKADKGALKKRRDISEPLRLLMGEVADPAENFAKTIMNISTMMHKADMERALASDRNNVLFSDKQTSSHTQELTESDSEMLVNKFGKQGKVYTTPDMARALTFDTKRENANQVYSALVAMNGIAKANLTIFAPDSQSRNFIGGFLMLANAGVIGGKQWNDAISAATQHFGKKHEAASAVVPPLFLAKTLSDMTTKMSKQQKQDLFLKLIRNGLADESVRGNIIEETSELLETQVKDTKVEKMFSGYKNVQDVASRIYQSSDIIPKAIQFMVERKRYAKAMYGDDIENLTEDQVEDVESFTSGRIRDEQPTYSQATQMEKDISKFPVVGAFVTFTSRRFKNQWSILKHGAEDINKWRNTGNREWLKNGSRKMISSMVFNSVLGGGIGYLSMMMYGWSDEEEEAQSRFYPGYAQNSQRIHIDSDKLNPKYIDLTFINPNSHMHKPVRAVMRGEGTRGFFEELAEPFMGNEIYFQHLSSTIKGKDQYGNEISKDDPSVNSLGYWEDIMSYNLQSMVPKIFYNTAELYYGANEMETHYGKRYSLGNEVLSNALGVNIKGRDNRKMFLDRMSGDNMLMNKQREHYQDVIKQYKEGDFTSKQEVEEAYKRELKEAEYYFKEMRKNIDAGMRLGMDEKDMNFWMKERNIPKHIRKQLLRGHFPGFDQDKGGWNSSSYETKPPGEDRLPF